MNNISEYKDIVAFHPGYYIADVIEDMGVSQAEFATRLGTNTKTLSYLLNGQANITNDLAKKLSAMMGTSPDVWLNLQNTYDKKLIEIQQAKDFDEQAEIVKLIDYKYFIEVVGLPLTKVMKEKNEVDPKLKLIRIRKKQIKKSIIKIIKTIIIHLLPLVVLFVFQSLKDVI